MTETSYFKVEFSNKTSENEDNNSTSTASNFQTILTKDLKLNDYLQLRTTHFEVALASLTIDNLPLAVTASENIIMQIAIIEALRIETIKPKEEFVLPIA